MGASASTGVCGVAATKVSDEDWIETSTLVEESIISSTDGNGRSGKISGALAIITFTTFWKIPRSGEIPMLLSGHIPGPKTMARLTAPILLTLAFLWTLVKVSVRIYQQDFVDVGLLVEMIIHAS